MQTVALCWWHEIGPFVPLSTDPLMLRADEGQQRKQHLLPLRGESCVRRNIVQQASVTSRSRKPRARRESVRPALRFRFIWSCRHLIFRFIENATISRHLLFFNNLCWSRREYCVLLSFAASLPIQMRFLSSGAHTSCSCRCCTRTNSAASISKSWVTASNQANPAPQPLQW